MQIQTFDYRKHYSRYRKYYDERLSLYLKSKQATAYTMIILSLFTVSFFGIFAIRPTLTTIVELKRKIDDATILDTALQKKIDTLVQAQEQYQFIKDFIPAIEEALPEKPDIANALLKIENIASEKKATVSALQVQSIVYKSPETATTSAENKDILSTKLLALDFSANISGTYEQVTGFLEKLFTMRRTVNALSLELIPEGKQTTLKLLLSLNIYYLK